MVINPIKTERLWIFHHCVVAFNLTVNIYKSLFLNTWKDRRKLKELKTISFWLVFFFFLSVHNILQNIVSLCIPKQGKKRVSQTGDIVLEWVKIFNPLWLEIRTLNVSGFVEFIKTQTIGNLNLASSHPKLLNLRKNWDTGLSLWTKDISHDKKKNNGYIFLGLFSRPYYFSKKLFYLWVEKLIVISSSFMTLTKP